MGRLAVCQGAPAGSQRPVAQVTVGDPWIRGTVPQQMSTGAFMQLKSATDAKLIEARSPVAGVVEIHEMKVENNVMRMRAVPSVALPAGRTVELKPGGYHVMMMDLKQQMKDGDVVPMTLVVESGGKRVGAPEDLVQILGYKGKINKGFSEAMMTKVDLIIATGGQGVVRRAYMSGTPAYAVGAGNATMIWDETAKQELNKAAFNTMRSKTSDFGSGCSADGNLVIHESIFDSLLKQLVQEGGYPSDSLGLNLESLLKGLAA